ncbi:MAG: hypothetical protein IT371_24470 [Deltaproteobacteria bacterium]|nr:hypothetical protein [Deltaproteobacteria bacterium]
MKTTRYTALVAAVLLGACGGMDDLEGGTTERLPAGAVPNGVCQKINFDNQGEAQDLTLGASGTTIDGSATIQVKASGGYKAFGVDCRTGACDDANGGITTHAYRVQLTGDSKLAARVHGADNLRLLIYQERDWESGGQATWEWNKSAAAWDGTGLAQSDVDNLTFRQLLPKGNYILAVVVREINGGGNWICPKPHDGYTVDAPNSASYRLWIATTPKDGTCGEIKLPPRVVLEEDSQWDSFVNDKGKWQFLAFPSFTMRASTEHDLSQAHAIQNNDPEFQYTFESYNAQLADPSFGSIKNDVPGFDFLERYKIGGFNPTNRILRWLDAAGSLVAYSREDTTEATVTNHIDILSCGNRIIGSLDEEKATGTFFTKYRIANADGFVVGWSLLMNTISTATGNVNTIIKIVGAKQGTMGPEPSDKIYAVITRTKNTMADRWVIDSSMAPKQGDIDPSTNAPYPYIDPRLFVMSAVGKTTGQNVHQYYDCVLKATPDGCADCCLDNGAGQFIPTGGWCQCR